MVQNLQADMSAQYHCCLYLARDIRHFPGLETAYSFQYKTDTADKAELSCLYSRLILRSVSLFTHACHLRAAPGCFYEKNL